MARTATDPYAEDAGGGRDDVGDASMVDEGGAADTVGATQVAAAGMSPEGAQTPGRRRRRSSPGRHGTPGSEGPSQEATRSAATRPAPTVPVVLRRCTFSYAANNPSEDRHAFLLVEGVLAPGTESGGDLGGGGGGAGASLNAELFLVADGHGGGLASQFAAENMLLFAKANLLALAERRRRRPRPRPLADASGGRDEAVPLHRTLAAAGDDGEEGAGAGTGAGAELAGAGCAMALDEKPPGNAPAAGGYEESPSGGGAESDAGLHEAVQACLREAFVATEAALLTRLDSTWDAAGWDASDRFARGGAGLAAAAHAAAVTTTAAAAADVGVKAAGEGGAAVAAGAPMVDSTDDDASSDDDAAAVAAAATIGYAKPDSKSSSSSSSSSSQPPLQLSAAAASAASASLGLTPPCQPGVCNAGTCAVLVCVLGGWLYTAHVGDCRAVLVSLKETAQPPAPPATRSPEVADGAGGGLVGPAAPAVGAPVCAVAGTAGRGRESPCLKRARRVPEGRRSSEAAGAPTQCGRGAQSALAARFSVRALTEDQTCYAEDECAAVRARAATDPEPIRPSRTDRRVMAQRARAAANRLSRTPSLLQGAGAAVAVAGAAAPGVAPVPSASSSSSSVPAPLAAVGGRKKAPKPPLLRVAGTLAVTRALGDMYLKHRRYSPDDFRPHVPYITAEPATSATELDPRKDLLVVLASDGLWEVAGAAGAAEWATAFLARHGAAQAPCSGAGPSGKEGSAAAAASLRATGPGAVAGSAVAGSAVAGSAAAAAAAPDGTAVVGRPTRGARVTLSQELTVQALAAVASAAQMSAAALGRLAPGPERRRFHDDITVTVLVFPAATEVFP